MARSRGLACWLACGLAALSWVGGETASAGAEASMGASAPVGATAQAGIRIEVTFSDADRQERATVSVRGRRIRVEQWTPGVPRSRRHVLIYQGDLDRFLSLDPRSKLYVAVDRDLIAAASVPMLAARREVDAQMERLPASQHAALELLLGLRENGRQPTRVPIWVRPLDGEGRVGALSCRRRELVRESAPIAELCVTDWSDVGIAAADLDVFRQLANFQRELMGARELTPLALVPDQGLELLVQFDGFPLSLRGVGRGTPLGEVRVTSVEPIIGGAALFDPPPDYQPRSAYSVLFGDPVPAAGSGAE